ncbi:hypothetical protein HY384_02285 [Candidatus Daviesbacteria bacterium]|nr:hypothetical protein [Candidatus Daviesbacteria bacterium]
MKSKWFHLKGSVIELRQKGNSIRSIERSLKIPRSTLSGWLKNVVLTQKQQLKLKRNWIRALGKARKQAAIWHNKQKQLRLKIAKEQALATLAKINANDTSLVELALAMLYLGEGSKKSGTAIGNTDPLILKFFINALRVVYEFDVSRIKCELHLRADQDILKTKRFWAKELNIPISSFTSVSIDKRTVGSPTYPTYNGVCILQCGNIAVQRRLVYLSILFCEKFSREWAVSSAGRASD